MRLIQSYSFEYNPNLEEPSAIYPDLVGSLYTMSLQTENEFFTALVGYNHATKRLFIEFYNSRGELYQNRINAVSEQNLFFLEGYYLYWKPSENVFEFGSVK